MRMTVVRHGETIENKNGIIQGHLPGQLSATGLEQARELAASLASEDYDYIFCSDLNRCRQTVEAIHEYQPQAGLKFTPRLREFNYGIYQGMAKEFLDWAAIKSQALDRPMPQGESWREVSGRVVSFLESIHRHRYGQNILLVTHRGPMRAIKAYMHNIPLEMVISEPIPNCGVLRFNMSETARLQPETKTGFYTA